MPLSLTKLQLVMFKWHICWLNLEIINSMLSSTADSEPKDNVLIFLKLGRRRLIDLSLSPHSDTSISSKLLWGAMKVSKAFESIKWHWDTISFLRFLQLNMMVWSTLTVIELHLDKSTCDNFRFTWRSSMRGSSSIQEQFARSSSFTLMQSLDNTEKASETFPLLFLDKSILVNPRSSESMYDLKKVFVDLKENLSCNFNLKFTFQFNKLWKYL